MRSLPLCRERYPRGAERADRGRDSRRERGRQRRRTPLPGGRLGARLQRSEPDCPASARLRRVRLGARRPYPRTFDPDQGVLMSENPMRDAIQSAISDNPVILFMKGTPEQPACGFSARTVAVLQSLGQPFAAVDVLPDPRIRQELSALSNWPTIPQLFIDGELVGGCDLVMEMYQSGELQQALGAEGAQETDTPEPEVAPREAPPLSIENKL